MTSVLKYHPRRKQKSLPVLAIQTILITLLLLLLSMVFWNLTLNALIREADWQQERLCRIYGVCDPKAGP